MKTPSKKVSDGTAPLTLEVRVHPRSGCPGLWKEPGGCLRAALRAAPEGGRANDELIRLVADRLGVARSDVELWRGHKSRQKILRIWGMDAEQLEQVVEAMGFRGTGA